MRNFIRLSQFGLLLLPLLATRAHGEVRVGNGGDAMAAGFVDMADETLEQIEKLSASGDSPLPSGLSLEQLRSQVQKTVVFTEDKTMLRDREVDALNFPGENKIIVSRSRWKNLAYDLKGLKTLVLHEYLSMIGAADASYQISNFVARKIFNGGSKGELWLAKDLEDRRPTNPFYNAWFELEGRRLIPGSGPKVRHLQDGKLVERSMLDPSLPHCTLTLSSDSPLPSSGAAVAVRLPIMFSKRVSNSDSLNSVSFDFQKPAFVKAFVCSAPNDARVTVKDVLDSVGNTMKFNHMGKGFAPSCYVD